MTSFFNKIINLGRRRETTDHDGFKSPKPGSTGMRAGASVPSPTSPKFFDDPSPDVNASNGGSRTLGARSKHKSEDALRNASLAQIWKTTTSPPASPRSPTTSSAPQLDLALAISSSIPRRDGKEGEGGVEEKNDVADEFGTLLLVPDGDRFTMLSDEDIAAKLLTPKDVIRLVQATSAVIHAQGLETLGVFHPHWLSVSRSSQRELISRYIATLPSASSTSSQDIFQSTLEEAQLTDVAAILKWGLRRMKLEGGNFGGAEASTAKSDGWGWYTNFAEAERMSSFPEDAFSKQLLPLLPPSHVDLLKDLLDLLSSVAAHAQGNGMFNTKLCKVLAWWVVCSRKWSVQNESKDTWTDFYDAWDRASRILEHIMLAYLRDQSRDARGLPVRLIELHTPYPPLSAALASYTSTSNSFPLPPRPRLTTRIHGALLVRLESPYGVKPRQPRDNPIRLLEEALDARPKYMPAFSYESIGNPYHDVWSEIRADVAQQRARAASPPPVVADVVSFHTVNADDDGALAGANAVPAQAPASSPILSILSDTTIRWLNLVAPPPPRKDKDEDKEEPVTPTIAVSTFAEAAAPHIPPSQMFRRRKSFSLTDSPTTYAGSSPLAVLPENETVQQAGTMDPLRDNRLSMGSILTINGKGAGIGDLGNLHAMMSSTSLASFLPEDDDYLKTFSTAGFLSPSQESGLGALGGDTAGLAQTLVQPAALELKSKTGSGKASGSGGQGGPSQNGKNEGRSFGSSPVKRKMTATSITSAISGRAGGSSRPSTDIQQSGTGTPNSSNTLPQSTTDVTPEDVAVLVVPPTRIELDEAFVDTWADTLLDNQAVGVPQAWPNFALFQLKTPRVAGDVNGGEAIEWLVVEQHVCTTPPPRPVSPAPESLGDVGRESRASTSGKKMKRSTSPSGLSARSGGTFRFGAGAGARARNRLSHFFGFSSNAKDDVDTQAPPSPPPNPPGPALTVTHTPFERTISAKKEEDDDEHFDVRSVNPPPPPDSTDPVPFPRTGGSSLVDENEEPEPISDQEAEAAMLKRDKPVEPGQEQPVPVPAPTHPPSQDPMPVPAREPEQEVAREPVPITPHEPTYGLARKPVPALARELEHVYEPVPAAESSEAAATVLPPSAVVTKEPKVAEDDEKKATAPANIPIPPTLSDISN